MSVVGSAPRPVDRSGAWSGPVGRLWAVRVAYRGHRSAGVLTLVCEGCRAPQPVFRDTGEARRAALAHLASHDAAAGPVATGTSCRCRAEEHAWHHARVRCGGGAVRAVSSETSGAAWRLVEVCAACAALMPRTTVIPTPAPAPQPVTQPPADVPAPRTAPTTTTGTEPMTTPTPAKDAKPGKPRLTAPQAVAARQLLAAVTGLQVGPEAQLLALVIAVRAAREGQANLTSLDMRRYNEPQAALDELVAGGQISGDVSGIVDADPAQAFAIRAPGLTELTDPPMGKTVRTRVSGWITRTLAAKPLKKTDAAARLAALWLILHADPTTGTGTIPGQVPEQILAGLDPGWITHDGNGGYQMSQIAAGYLPAPDQQN